MSRLLATALALVVPAAANAESEKYLCNFTGHNSLRKIDDGGFVPSKYMLTIDAGNKTATAYDGLVHEVYQAPIPAKFSKKGNGNYRLRWKISGVPVTITKTVDYGIPDVIETKFNVRYSLLLNPETLQGTLSVSGGGERFASAANLDCKKTNQNLVFREATN
ncbi:hypothetical protein [Leisingera daeponensis]|uniref:hypothetical protein n=1 Tax=Leisingera daeponensis TaxID=405746 RepID=UPI001C93BBEB|nr:hypothetical protein [Leisingera daeponensis]MBY6056011.1 hypothetical protein [Leisingera daeponensis]